MCFTSKETTQRGSYKKLRKSLVIFAVKLAKIAPNVNNTMCISSCFSSLLALAGLEAFGSVGPFQ